MQRYIYIHIYIYIYIFIFIYTYMYRPISCAHTRLRNTSLRHPHLFPLLIFYSSDFCKHSAFTHPKKGLCHKCHHPTLPLSEHRIDCARPVRTQGPAKVFPLAQSLALDPCTRDTRPATTAKGDSSAASASTPHRMLLSAFRLCNENT